MVFPQLTGRPSIEMYVGLAIILAMLEWLIVIIGRRSFMVTEITEQSSHTKPTPTCGGIIWVLTAICAVAAFGDLRLQSTWIFMGGIVILGTIAFIDDIHPLPPVPRLICQIAVMALSFKQLFISEAFDIYLLVLFVGVGIINAVNFLDGIRGMLGLYGLIVTGSLLYAVFLYHSNSTHWITLTLSAVFVAQAVFTCFNLYDVIFAGDVGAITLGYIQVYAATFVILQSHDASILIFFSVCIFDTGLTTLHRLFSGESILKPHRKHIYQKLTTDKKIPQVVVSLIYALLQLLINAMYFLIPASQHWTYFLIVCALLTVTYFALRFSFRH